MDKQSLVVERKFLSYSYHVSTKNVDVYLRMKWKINVDDYLRMKWKNFFVEADMSTQGKHKLTIAAN